MKTNFIKYKHGCFLKVVLILLIAFSFSWNVSAEPKKYKLGDIPLSKEAYQKHLKKMILDKTIIEQALPASYDARNEGIVTLPKDQGSCGSCWAFACAGALESHLVQDGLATTTLDLSEQQQVSCNTAMWGCDGGSSTALRFWEEPTGPQNEIDFQYTANDATPCIEEHQLGFHVIDFHTVNKTTTAFKDSLYIYGPSYWRYDVYSDFYTYWGGNTPGTVYVNGSGTYQGGHAVLLIGWDDSKQAFLCKNSWGETDGPNGDGTFWIAYSGHASDLRFGMANFSVVSTTCESNADCDDGLFCNGLETCVDGTCQSGNPPDCSDDGKFCNGSEFCNEETDACDAVDPCSAGETCFEDEDYCIPASCGNGSCDEGEDCINCSEDCISGDGGGDCSDCFKGVCDGSCHPRKDGPDCSDCQPAYCCGDGVCNGSEDSTNCPLDCGDTPTKETNCSNGLDDDGDGKTDCDDTDCTDDPACQGGECLPKKSPCSLDTECCSGDCLPRGVCK